MLFVNCNEVKFTYGQNRQIKEIWACSLWPHAVLGASARTRRAFASFCSKISDALIAKETVGHVRRTCNNGVSEGKVLLTDCK
jgi:hypothetical protein